MKKKELMTLTPAKLTAYMRKMAKKEISDDWVLHSTAGKRYYYKLCLSCRICPSGCQASVVRGVF